MRRVDALVMVVLFMSIASGCAEYRAQGTGDGALTGTATGAVLDHRNLWRGGVAGGVLGAVAGATVEDISVKGSREAVEENRPIEYRTDDGRGRYYAEPSSDYYYSDDGRARCRKVHERMWEDGRLVKDRSKDVCERVRSERRY